MYYVVRIQSKDDDDVKTHYNDPLWGVTFYYFPRMCMFECIPPQTWKKFKILLHLMLEYNLSKILERI